LRHDLFSLRFREELANTNANANASAIASASASASTSTALGPQTAQPTNLETSDESSHSPKLPLQAHFGKNQHQHQHQHQRPISR